jgi:hypothetical protein
VPSVGAILIFRDRELLAQETLAPNESVSGSIKVSNSGERSNRQFTKTVAANEPMLKGGMRQRNFTRKNCND